jgi:hypothetical protein
VNDLNSLEIAAEKARRETAKYRFELTNLVSNIVRERRDRERAKRALSRLDHLYGDGDGVTRRRRRLRPFTVVDLDSAMEKTVGTLRRIGLTMVPIYVSTLQTEFELSSAWRSIERSMDESFVEVKRRAVIELGSPGKAANRILDKTKKALSQTKVDVYRELQINSHSLRSKIARRATPNREDRRTKTSVPEVSFMQQGVLRDFAARMAEEACLCFDARAYTATAILAGSAMEAILLDALQRRPRAAGQNDLAERPLSDLIQLALRSGLIGQSTTKLTHWIRENRNLLHPGRVLRQKRTVEREESEMCLSILKLICKEARTRLNAD